MVMVGLFRRRRRLAGDLGFCLVVGTVPGIGWPVLALSLLLVGVLLILAAGLVTPAGQAPRTGPPAGHVRRVP
jgi:hypothetical protein